MVSHGQKPTGPDAINKLSDLRIRLYQSIGVLLGVVIVSTIGFVVLGWPETNWHVALWETFNLISTVGSLDEMNVAERSWAMIVIIFGLGATLYGFGNLSALLTSGEILHAFERRTMERRISALSDHIVLCGFGNTGRQVAEQLSQHAKSFVVIENAPDAAEQARNLDYLVIEDDCTQESVLEQAGLRKAQGLVASLSQDADNVFVVLTARGMSEDLYIVSRANLPQTVRQLERAGVNQATVPSQIAALQMADAVFRPALGEFMARARRGQEIELAELRVSDHQWMVGRSLRDLHLMRRADLIVFAMIPRAGAQIFNPDPDTIVNEGDLLLTVTRKGASERLRELDKQARSAPAPKP